MNPDERACPYCGEAIKMVAIKCKHCMASVKSCVPEIPTKNQKENTEVKQIEAKKDQSNNINTFDFIKNEDKFKSSKFIKNIAKILTFVWCVVIYFYYAYLSTYIGIFTSNEIQGTVKQVSIVMFLMSCLFLIGTLCFFARLHGAGFRWFTKYKKDTMPDFTWRYLIQIFSNLFASILISFAFIFVNFDYNNTINYLLIFCILTVVLYGIALIMVSKLTFGITLSESWRASTVPILVLCLLLSPAIYIYGSLAIQQNKMQEIVEQYTNTNKEQSSEIYNQKNYEENYSSIQSEKHSENKTQDTSTNRVLEKPGECVDTKIVKKITRLENSIPGQNGGDVVVELGNEVSLYLTEVEVKDNNYEIDINEYMYYTNDYVNGDIVRLCLVALPNDCPPGDDRGKEYSVTNYRNRLSFKGVDSWHMCGGA